MRNIALLIYFLLLLTSCKIIIVNGKEENEENFKVDLNTKPSVLINQYIVDSLYRDKINFIIISYDIYCGYSNEQIYYCNKLYNETKKHFEWIAITYYDTAAESFQKKLISINQNYRFKFITYYNINGLKTSLKKLYFQNDLKNVKNRSQTIMIIENDSILKINAGIIDNETKYSSYRQYLDSIISSKAH